MLIVWLFWFQAFVFYFIFSVHILLFHTVLFLISLSNIYFLFFIYCLYSFHLVLPYFHCLLILLYLIFWKSWFVPSVSKSFFSITGSVVEVFNWFSLYLCIYSWDYFCILSPESGSTDHNYKRIAFIRKSDINLKQKPEILTSTYVQILT
jgi:hypothetical protein